MFVVVGILIVISLVLFVIFLLKPSPKAFFTGETAMSDPQPRCPKYEPPTNFKIFNYFPYHLLRVSVLDAHGQETILVDGIPPLKTKGLTKDKVEIYLRPGNMLRFYITDPEGTMEHLSESFIDNEPDERIKNLHVGMVTTRFIGTSTDGLRMTTMANNAIQGHAWLKIHNLTNIPLRLNDDVQVAPHSTERYLGYLHQGVTLGTIFKDQDQRYPDFQYLNPHSDLYYGVVSDLRQPIYGPFQLEYNDDADADQTLWPFELGQM